MRRRTLIIVGALELLAALLTKWQSLGGVRTDEAKYLLNIPYPHPPFLRSIFSATEWLPFQEIFWRFVMASLLVQAVWLVWDLCRDFRLEDRGAACAGWMLSAALLTQAGSVMMAPATALQALLFLWLRRRPALVERHPLAVGLAWLATVFTAFQGALFAPLAWSAFRRGGHRRAVAAAYVLGPLALLALWSLSNPLALATMVIHAEEGARTLAERFAGLGKLWIAGGSGVVSFFGTWGILRSSDRMLQASAALLCLYVLGSIPYPFYAILFTPLFVAGLFELFRTKSHPHGFPLLGAMIAGCAVATWLFRPPTDESTARAVLRAIDEAKPEAALVLVSGSFGHQWQYETRAVVERYRPERAAEADAVVCLSPCEPIFNTAPFERLGGAPVEAWARK